MRFGVCADYETAPQLKAAGYDYIEGNMRSIAEMSEEDFAKTRSVIQASGIKAETFCCFFNGGAHVLVGDKVDYDVLGEYMEVALYRASLLGGQVAVLGSGAARNVPDGYDRNRALEQFSQVARIAGDIAEKNGMLIAVEPLRRDETNLINTVEQGIEFIDALAHPAVRVLADLYHVYDSGETLDAIKSAGSKLAHVHIAEPIKRAYPSADDGFDYRPFFNALTDTGYDVRISVEAKKDPDFALKIADSLRLLKSYYR